MVRLLDRFDLDSWAEFGFEEQKRAILTPNTSPGELSKNVVTLAEEMLHLVISVIGLFASILHVAVFYVAGLYPKLFLYAVCK